MGKRILTKKQAATVARMLKACGDPVAKAGLQRQLDDYSQRMTMADGIADVCAAISAGKIPEGFEAVRCPDCGATGLVPTGGAGQIVCYSVACIRRRGKT
jgi:hypothetical protein